MAPTFRLPQLPPGYAEWQQSLDTFHHAREALTAQLDSTSAYIDVLGSVFTDLSATFEQFSIERHLAPFVTQRLEGFAPSPDPNDSTSRDWLRGSHGFFPGAARLRDAYARTLLSLLRLRIQLDHIKRLLRHVTRAIYLILRARLRTHAVREFVTQQRSWHLHHGAHPPPYAPSLLQTNLPGALA
jgi:hypothetical protein